MKKICFILFALLVLICLSGCGPTSAQFSQSRFTTVTPGTPLFAVSSEYYQVNVRAGSLTAYTEGDTDTKIEVYDLSAALIAEDDDSGTQYNARVNVPVTAGTYYIRVDFYGNDGPYVLHVENSR